MTYTRHEIDWLTGFKALVEETARQANAQCVLWQCVKGRNFQKDRVDIRQPLILVTPLRLNRSHHVANGFF